MDKLRAIVVSIRPKHWIKNVFMLAGPFFSLKFFQPEHAARLVLGFVCWCVVTSALYLFNDIVDRKSDSVHPHKKTRPLASGILSVSLAATVLVVLALTGISLSYALDADFGVWVLLYVLVNIAYSLYLKRVFIVDVMCIAAGFVFRVISGAMLIGVGMSEWIIMCAMLLSLFLGFGKRQEELTSLDEQAHRHRAVLKEYDQGFLQHIPYVLVAATLVCYMLYTVSPETVRKFQTANLIFTTPFVIYGLFRYVYIAYEKKKGADPTQVLFQDVPTVVNIVLWLVATALIIYRF